MKIGAMSAGALKRGRVRCDAHVRQPPEDVVGRQRLGLEDIEHRAREAALLKTRPPAPPRPPRRRGPD